MKKYAIFEVVCGIVLCFSILMGANENEKLWWVNLLALPIMVCSMVGGLYCGKKRKEVKK